jgi:pimeloyl-ACP methyl ester carboxylesterase
MTADQGFSELRFITRDGLKLYARHYPAHRPVPNRRRVVCLPGLTRNGRDFHEFAVALSGRSASARDVYTLDYRGRGHSQWDSDWKNYAVPVEALDVVDFMTMAGLYDAAIVGTSRGGLIAMVLAATQPGFLGAVILNDIGPVIDQKGLTRISAYVGRMPLPRTWDEAGRLVADMHRKAFPAVAESEWEPVARQWFNEKNGRPAPGYDPKLSNALSVLDGPMPELWPQFEALKRVPLMVLRGEKSDILSAATVDEMRRRHPAFSDFTVKGQGHAPLLRDPASITAVREFLDAVGNATTAPALVATAT